MSLSDSFDKTSLIISVMAEPDESQFNGMYSGSSFDFNSWIAKVTLETKTNKLSITNPSETSTLVKKEQVESTLEIAAGRIIAHLFPKDLIVIDSWSICHRIIEAVSSNSAKYQMLPLKLSQQCEFVLMSGATSINILNVGNKKMSQLVQSKTACDLGQSKMFITKEENGFQLNWTIEHLDSDNKTHNEWFTLNLRDDFVSCLKEIGTLPPTTTKDLIFECKQRIKFEQ